MADDEETQPLTPAVDESPEEEPADVAAVEASVEEPEAVEDHEHPDEDGDAVADADADKEEPDAELGVGIEVSPLTPQEDEKEKEAHVESAEKETNVWFFAHTPISIFAVCMGLSGLAIVFKKANAALDDDRIGTSGYKALAIFSAVHFGIFNLLYCLKLLFYPKMVLQEFQHPIKANFFPTWDINLLLFSILAIPDRNTFARALFWIGACVQLVFTLYLMSRWFQKQLPRGACTPVCFIPVVGNLLSAIPAAKLEKEKPVANLSYAEFGLFCFSVGVLFWIVMLANNYARLVMGPPLPQKLVPSLFILIAPPAIAALAYSDLIRGTDLFHGILTHLALFFLLLCVASYRLVLEAIRARGFQMPWWAFTFPMDAVAVCTIHYYGSHQSIGFEVISWILLCAATVVVGVVYAAWLMGIAVGKVFAPEKELPLKEN